MEEAERDDGPDGGQDRDQDDQGVEEAAREQESELREMDESSQDMRSDVEELEERTSQLGQEVDEARQDWERKKQDSSVPGAEPGDSPISGQQDQADG